MPMPRPPSTPRKSHTRLWLLLSGTGLALVIAVVVWWPQNHRQSTSEVVIETDTTLPPPPPPLPDLPEPSEPDTGHTDTLVPEAKSSLPAETITKPPQAKPIVRDVTVLRILRCPVRGGDSIAFDLTLASTKRLGLDGPRAQPLAVQASICEFFYIPGPRPQGLTELEGRILERLRSVFPEAGIHRADIRNLTLTGPR